MGVDTHLYINSKWRIDDIKDLVEKIVKGKVEVEPAASIGYYRFHFK